MTTRQQRTIDPASPDGPRLIVHVGMTKAGSTAIQNYLDQNRDALGTQGVLVPKTGFARRNPFDPERTSGHIELVKQICKGNTEPIDQELHESGAGIIVLSAENILLDRPDEELAALAHHFSGRRVTVVAILRGQQAWLRSRYVENVLSGFKNSTQTGRQFMAEAIDKGWMDYLAAIERVNRLLSADEVRLLNYDASTRAGNLVETFLRAAGLPLTDPGLLATIQANVREKDLALVEAQRRLNYLLQRWPRDMRLKFEAIFQDAAKARDRRMDGSARAVDETWLPMSDAVCATVSAANAKLANAYGLAPPLESPAPVAEHKYQHRDSPEDVDDLVLRGLKLAATMGTDTGNAAQLTRSPASPALLLGGIHSLVDLLSSAQVSLHLGSVDTAVAAATLSSRFSIFIPLDNDDSTAEVAAMLQVKLPSEIVCLRQSSIAGSGSRIPVAGRSYRLDLVIARGSGGTNQFSDVFGRATPDCPIALIECDPDVVADVLTQFDLDVSTSSDDCVVLVPPENRVKKGLQ